MMKLTEIHYDVVCVGLGGKNKGFSTVVLLFYMFVWLVLVPSKRKGLSSLHCLTEKKKRCKIYESKKFNFQCRTPCRTPCSLLF